MHEIGRAGRSHTHAGSVQGAAAQVFRQQAPLSRRQLRALGLHHARFERLVNRACSQHLQADPVGRPGSPTIVARGTVLLVERLAITGAGHRCGGQRVPARQDCREQQSRSKRQGTGGRSSGRHRESARLSTG